MKKSLEQWNNHHPGAMFAWLWGLFFLAVCLIGYAPFWMEGRGFIWSADGRTQYYPFLIYLGNWIRSGFPAFDFALGMGDDPLFTFGFLGILDPLNWLFVFVREGRAAELLYDLLVLVRLYLAGLTFGCFCFYHHRSQAGALAGALIYTFCGYAIQMGNQYPSFSIPLIYLPLMLVGFDLILNGKKPWLFCGMVFYAAITGFYFLFMVSVALVLYGLVRGLAIHGKNIKTLFIRLMTAVFWYLAALGLSAPVFVPMVRGYLNCSRSGTAGSMGLMLGFYPAETCKNLLLGFFSGPWSFETMGLCALVLGALAALFSCKGEWPIKVSAALGILLVFMPGFGYLMNGGGYITHRWTFLLSFLLAYVVAALWENLRKNPLLPAIVMGAGAVLYGALAAAEQNRLFGLAAVMLAVTLAALLGARRLGTVLLVGAVALNAAGNLLMENAAFGENYTAEYLYRGEWLSRQETNFEQFETLKADTDFYRLEQPGTSKNASWTEGWFGTGMYISVMNGFYCDTMMNWEVSPDINTNYDFEGLDGRSGLETLSAVRYAILNGGERPPMGFEPVEQVGGKVLYRNCCDNGLVWAYTDVIAPEDAYELNGIQRQAAALSAVTLNGEHPMLNRVMPEGSLLWLEPQLTTENLAYEDIVLLAEQNAAVQIQVDVPESGELYLRMGSLNPAEYVANIWTDGNGLSKRVTYFNRAHPEYYRTPGCTVCLGRVEPGEQTITVRPDVGYYILDGFQMWLIPEEGYLSDVQALRENGRADHVTVEKNTLSGDLTLTQTAQAVFAIPYSSGWRLTIDGTPVPTEPANGIFLSATVGEGTHRFALRYTTPGLKTGLALFGMTIVGLNGLWLLGILLRRRKIEK